MEELQIVSQRLVSVTDLQHQRYLMAEIDWSYRLIGIKGARGTGKTTMLLQQMKLSHSAQSALYFSLDDVFFAENSLIETIKRGEQLGISHFYIDEVHKYPNWATELKNAYDQFPNIRIVFTGSSILDLKHLEVDLSRRAILFELFGLSFREYLNMTSQVTIPSIGLEDLMTNHSEIALELAQQVKPLASFQAYLESGYYPFFLEGIPYYYPRINQVIRAAIEVDATNSPLFNLRNPRKVLQLLQVLSSSVPFHPNLTKLSAKIGINRNTLIQYLFLLHKSRLLRFLVKPEKSVSSLQKPEKLYLDNPNLLYVLSKETPNAGTIRETFFLNQLGNRYEVHATDQGDFLVEEKFYFEVGGRSKSFHQLGGVETGYVAADDLEVGAGKKIPLWMFGLLY